jgi:CRP-like cAMP-binding protein
VLAHRDVRDWYVFEAASWALAERRMPAERRRELWLEPLPAAELAAQLRKLPLFASVTVDELFRIAGAARQVRHESGSILLQEGATPDNVHLLLDGRVTTASRQRALQSMDAPAALGFEEALQGVPMRETIRTSERAVTLALSSEELRTLLADNTDLVSGLFTTLAARMETLAVPIHHTGVGRDLEQLAIRGLTPVEKVLALQHVPLFAKLSADEMRRLAAIARTVTLTPGSALFAESAPPALWLIVAGELALERSAGAPLLTAAVGDVVGLATTMSGAPLGRSAAVTRSGVALRIDRDELFEVLGERPEMLKQMFAGLFRADPVAV